ncbi:SRPBCC family protein [Actinocorallia sp. A-T 12471]|uniref:SRPBCC family protein n=1 Tax=Actinocorallia sp. A-T 12471 TaxID=3089813 RepID=UPI0029CAD750|nr:SRPBCC family protein [Actinocorallia sp. A-T 12471]MDX6739583.1 SRPBCC family protein [Actinocorallia sp. A-T 12471]
MELQHSFTVPVPASEAAGVLHDVTRLAPCMPGAVLDGFDGVEFTGRMSVKVGAITMSYRGKGRFLDGDADTVALRVEAAETKGAGAVAADVVCRLADEGGATRVVVDTRVDISGRAAQFGRGVISEVGDKVVAAFAANIQAALSATPEPAHPAPAAPAQPATSQPASGQAVPAQPAFAPVAAAPLDLGSVAGPVLVKKAAPFAVVLGLLLAFLLGRRTSGYRLTRD